MKILVALGDNARSLGYFEGLLSIALSNASLIYDQESLHMAFPNPYPNPLIVSAGLLFKALSIASLIYDQDSLPMALILHSRAQLLRDLGDLTEASRIYPLALKIFKEKLGSKCSYVAEIMGDIGESLRLEGRVEEANISLKSALLLRTKCFTETHSKVAEVNLSQALILSSNDPLKSLEILKEKVVPVLGSCFGSQHPMLMYCHGINGKFLNLIAVQNTMKNRTNDTENKHGGNMEKNSPNPNPEEGQAMIDLTLSYFDSYPLSPFGNAHPWVLELDGWGKTNNEGIKSNRNICRSDRHKETYLIETEYENRFDLEVKSDFLEKIFEM